MHNTTSPDTSEESVERELQRKGKTAPRLNPQMLTDNIESVDYVLHTSRSGQVLRWAVLNLRNGFAAVGAPSVAVSSENDDADVGRAVALENSRQALWPLMGYALKEKLHTQALAADNASTSDHQAQT